MDQRSIEKHLRRWQRRDKGNGDPVVINHDKERVPGGRVHSPTTGSGLPVQDQLRKQWDPTRGGGLPVFCAASARVGKRAARPGRHMTISTRRAAA